MSVVDVKLHWKSNEGRLVEDGLEYRVIYLVTTNEAFDDAHVVLTDPRLPRYNSGYRVGNGRNPQAFLREMRARRDPKGRLTWFVTCTYRTPSPSEFNQSNDDPVPGGPEPGTPTDQPTPGSYKVFSSLEIGIKTKRKVVSMARFVGAFHMGTDIEGRARVVHRRFDPGGELYPGRPVNSWGPVTNSSGVPKLPAPEIEDHNLLFRVTRYFPRWNPRWDSFIHSINSDDTTIKDPTRKLYSRKFPKHTLKVNAIYPKEKITNLSIALYVTMEVEYNPDSWLHDELDSGDMRRVRSGYADGFGGTYPSDLSTSGVTDGVPPLEAIRDPSHNRVTGDVLLDGSGGVLNHRSAITAHYLTFALHDAVSFRPLKLDFRFP